MHRWKLYRTAQHDSNGFLFDCTLISILVVIHSMVRLWTMHVADYVIDRCWLGTKTMPDITAHPVFLD